MNRVPRPGNLFLTSCSVLTVLLYAFSFFRGGRVRVGSRVYITSEWLWTLSPPQWNQRLHSSAKRGLWWLRQGAERRGRGFLCARKSPYALHPPLGSSDNIAFETVPLFVWLTTALSRLFKKDPRAPPLLTPLSSRRPVVWCSWFCARR